jgi:hypothetical protein
MIWNTISLEYYICWHDTDARYRRNHMYGCVFSFAWQVADEVYSWNYELSEDEGGEGWKAVGYLHLYGISYQQPRL